MLYSTRLIIMESGRGTCGVPYLESDLLASNFHHLHLLCYERGDAVLELDKRRRQSN